jgi:ribosomal-protein-alanine N-acetyltransferase
MMAASPRVIAFAAAMLPIAAALHRAAFGAEGWDEKAIAELLAMPGAQGRIAIDAEDNPLGFLLSLHIVDTAELLTLAVAPASQRLGVGRLLVRDFVARAKLGGATNAFLEVAEDNIPAISLYKREGFAAEGRRRDYYHRSGNIRVDAHILRRSLAQI